MRNQGFSIIELMIVIVIIGILATLSVSTMRDPIERGRAKNAEFNLLSIYSAQKRYLLSERQYFICKGANLEDRVFEIAGNLSIKIDDEYFYYDIDVPATGGYRARAIRKDGGKCAGQEMNLTSGNSTVDKRGCPVW